MSALPPTGEGRHLANPGSLHIHDSWMQPRSSSRSSAEIVAGVGICGMLALMPAIALHRVRGAPRIVSFTLKATSVSAITLGSVSLYLRDTTEQNQRRLLAVRRESMHLSDPIDRLRERFNSQTFILAGATVGILAALRWPSLLPAARGWGRHIGFATIGAGVGHILCSGEHRTREEAAPHQWKWTGMIADRVRALQSEIVATGWPQSFMQPQDTVDLEESPSQRVYGNPETSGRDSTINKMDSLDNDEKSPTQLVLPQGIGAMNLSGDLDPNEPYHLRTLPWEPEPILSPFRSYVWEPDVQSMEKLKERATNLARLKQRLSDESTVVGQLIHDREREWYERRDDPRLSHEAREIMKLCTGELLRIRLGIETEQMLLQFTLVDVERLMAEVRSGDIKARDERIPDIADSVKSCLKPPKSNTAQTGLTFTLHLAEERARQSAEQWKTVQSLQKQIEAVLPDPESQLNEEFLNSLTKEFETYASQVQVFLKASGQLMDGLRTEDRKLRSRTI